MCGGDASNCNEATTVASGDSQGALKPGYPFRDVPNGGKAIEPLYPCSAQSMDVIRPWGRDIHLVKQLFLTKGNSWGTVKVAEINVLVLWEV